MSSTTTQTTTVPASGTFVFIDPDSSIGADERGYFALPAAKEQKLYTLPLHDYRTDPNITKGPLGLSKHGFTVVNHKSALSPDSWFSEKAILDTYLPEIQALIKNVTGARKVVPLHAAFRRRSDDDEALGSKKYTKKGEEGFHVPIDKEKPAITGLQVDKSLDPARGVHCDYTANGARSMIRHYRKDITDATADVIAAEDECAKTPGMVYNGARYAVYSIWRPLRPVRRDPLAIADWASVAQEDFIPNEYRQPGIEEDFKTEFYTIRPGPTTAEQRWYWLPEQKPDEVFVIKLADSEAVKQPGMAGCAPHGSPRLDGTEDETPRESIEVRAVAIW